MFHHLRVRNLGLLEDVSIAPSPGLTVITGETGAGKTLLLGGIRLLTGAKADGSAVGPFGDHAVVEGLFGDRDEVAATRQVPAEGRSRAYIDGTLVASGTLRERVGSVIEVVGQHDQLSLRGGGTLLGMIDSQLPEQGRDARSRYWLAWERLKTIRDRLEALGGDGSAIRRELDLVRYQADEIERSGYGPGDDVQLEQLAARLRNADEIRQQLGVTSVSLEEISDSLGEAVASLRRVSALDPANSSLTEGAEGLAASLAEVMAEVRRSGEELDIDQRALEEVEERLTALGDLKRKYGRTLDDVLRFGLEASRRAAELETILADADHLADDLADAEAEVTASAAELGEARRRVATDIEQRARGHLADLALERATLSIAFESVMPGPSGSDRVTLMFSSDPGLQPGPIGSVASGGELSRLVLAFRLATTGRSTRTLVFDEVDAGIGGATALAMGAKLAALAESSQVLCVTHLPQVAAHADAHYAVERAGSVALVRRVEEGERLQELSRMLAGLPESEAGHQAASELLAAAGR